MPSYIALMVNARAPSSEHSRMIPLCFTVPSSLVLASELLVLIPSPSRAVRVMVPDSMATLSLPFRALSAQSTVRVRFLTDRSSLECIPLLLLL